MRIQRKDTKTQRRNDFFVHAHRCNLSPLAPGFSQVSSVVVPAKPFQRFLSADAKPLKRFVPPTVVNTRLKLGANQIMVRNTVVTQVPQPVYPESFRGWSPISQSAWLGKWQGLRVWKPARQPDSDVCAIFVSAWPCYAFALEQ